MENSSIKDNDLEEEEEEEEVFVYASFETGAVDKDVFQQPDVKLKIIGLDSDTPIVQLGNITFQGVWKDTIGTKVLFEEDTSPAEVVDPVFTVIPPKMLKYKCKTTKTLELSRIFLKTKVLENQIDNKNDVTDAQSNLSAEEKKEISELANSTLDPDVNTDVIMKDIVEDSTKHINEH